MPSIASSAPRIELLVVDGCRHAEATRSLIESVALELDLEVEVETIVVADAASAEQHRFLGSPTVRINDHDIEPGADARTAYALACRVYRSRRGSFGQPDEDWVRSALSPDG